MATVLEFVNAALKEKDYTEEPPGSNRTKFAKEAGHANGAAWCATFVVAVARRVGIKLPNESAYTPTMAQGFKDKKQWIAPKDIKPGDVVFFDFPDAKNRIQHVGIATKVPKDGKIECIEGNTSSGDHGSQDNGGGVFLRNRPLSYVVGAGRPTFGAPPAPVAPATPKETVKPMYDPALNLGNVVAFLPRPGGAIVLNEDGAIYAFGCRDAGAPNRHPEYWPAGSKAANLHPLGETGYYVIARGASTEVGSAGWYAYP